jgi:hypothetical protein
MPEKSSGSSGSIGLKPRNVLIIIVLVILFIIFWSTFVIVPAGSRGVVLWWGSVEKRIMGEGLNFKVPIAETVIKVDVRVQPHPFKEIDASSKEYQIVKMTGMMNFHIDPTYVNELYQKVGLDFAQKVIDPAFNDFVKEVVPTYPIGEILPFKIFLSMGAPHGFANLSLPVFMMKVKKARRREKRGLLVDCLSPSVRWPKKERISSEVRESASLSPNWVENSVTRWT